MPVYSVPFGSHSYCWDGGVGGLISFGFGFQEGAGMDAGLLYSRSQKVGTSFFSCP